ncbi:hypothetical protein HDU93_003856 [Gonapodya sp. JEL0774]|nr:hypothetical protein HDU93_003856 [Gonapodya sp. JEL0774]
MAPVPVPTDIQDQPTAFTPPHKTVTSALVAIPPSHLWKGIQHIRRSRDKSFLRWPPHINILYPFVPRALFDIALPSVRSALESVAPFNVSLNAVASFHHSNSATLFLDSHPSTLCSTPFIQLHSALLSRFPHCTDLSSRADPASDSHSGYRPHLSLGQVALPRPTRSAARRRGGRGPDSGQAAATSSRGQDDRDHDTVIAAAESDFFRHFQDGASSGCLEWTVDRVYLIARSETDKSAPFEICHEVLLGRVGTGAGGAIDDGALGCAIPWIYIPDPDEADTLSDSQSDSESDSEPQIDSDTDNVPDADHISFSPVPAQAFSPSFHYHPETSSWTSSPPPLTPRTVSSRPTHLRLLSWNVLYTTSPAGPPPTPDTVTPDEVARMNRVAELVAASGADVVALQEVSDWVARYPFTHRTVDLGGKEAVVARIVVAGDVGEGTDADEAKVEVEVWSVHLTSDYRGYKGKTRSAQIHSLLSHLTPTPSTSTTHILLGDFNSDSPSLFTPLLNPTSPLPSFIDAWSATHGVHEGGHTFDPRENLLAKLVARQVDVGRRYDRVFVGQDGKWKVERCEVVPPRPADVPDDQDVWLSDHSALLVTLSSITSTFSVPTSGSVGSNTVTAASAVSLTPSTTATLTAATLHDYLASQNQIAPSDSTTHINALTLLRTFVAKSLHPHPTRVYPVGSFAMSTHTPDSDIDVVAASVAGPDEFWDAVDKALAGGVDGVDLVRWVGEGVKMRIVTVRCAGVLCDVSYVCMGVDVMEELDEAIASADTSKPVVPNLPANLHISAATALRDALVLSQMVPAQHKQTFPDFIRLLKLWAARRGVYSARLGFLGGAAVTVMVVRWLRSGGDPTDPLDFFKTFASWDYFRRVVSVGDGAQRSIGRSSNSGTGVSISKDNPPLQVLAPSPPHVNLVRNSTLHTLRQLQEELARAERVLSEQLAAGKEWTAVLDKLCEDGTEEFLIKYDKFVRIKIAPRQRSALVGSSSSKGRGGGKNTVGKPRLSKSPDPDFVRSLEEAAAFIEAKVIGLLLSLPAGTWARPWHARFDGDSCILVGLEGSPAIQDLVAKWMKVDVRGGDGYRSAWGDVEASVVGKGDPSMSWLSVLVPGLPATLALAGAEQKEKDSNKRLRPANEVFNRILWDPSMQPLSDWVVGYEDRFAGVQECLVSDFSREATDETFIPLHRIRYFKRKNAIVWDRTLRIDRM